MKCFGTARLGSSMEIRYMANGDPVGQVSLAFRLSKKDKAGDYMTQWISASMFGKRAETLAPMLTKGSLHAFFLRDLHIDEFTGKDGATRTSMKATIEDVELCGKQDNQKPAQHTASRAAMKSQAPAGGVSNGFDDMDDDSIPF